MLVTLGGLTAIPPLAFDMYLPALPNIADDFGVSESRIQLTLSACLIGIALGQLFGGPISDALGRRRPILAGVAGFTLFSFACAVAPSISVLVLLRFLQGLFGGVAVVISRAVVRDRTADAQAARVFSMLMLIGGTAPIVAPVIGGLLIEVTSWRGIFVVLGVLGLAGGLSVIAVLPETLPSPARRPGSLRDTVAVAARVGRDTRFLGFAFTGGFGFGAMFFFISSSSFVFQDVYDLSAPAYSGIFAGSAVGLMALGYVNATLLKRCRPESLLWFGTVQLVIGGAALCVVLWFDLGLVAVISAVYIANLSIPFIAPNATALALDPYGREAGTVSAYLGVVQFAVAAVASPLAGLFGDTTEYSMAFGILTMGLFAFTTRSLLVGRTVGGARHVLNQPTSASPVPLSHE